MKNDLTKGNILKQLILLTIPLLLGNILQQCYSTIDSIICGNFIGSVALAAIGSSESIINLVTGALFGFATGASILVGKYVGAKDDKKLLDLIHNAIFLTLVSGIISTIIGILLLKPILVGISTPDNVFSSSYTYLFIYFIGITPVMLYNMITGILRGMGNTKTPLYFLAFTSLVNVVLDLLFICIFKMGVAGAAIATIISQSISSLLCLYYLYSMKIGFSFSKLSFNKHIIIEILKIAIPTATGAIVIDISNVLVQSYINSFGSNAMAGCNTYFRFDLFILMPSKSFGYAIETFTAQNNGAHNISRVKEGLRTTLALGLITIFGFMFFVYFFGGNILRIFNQETEVLYYGNYVLKHLIYYYPLLTINHICSGCLRGLGRAVSTNVVGILSMCGLRQIILYVGTTLTTSFIIIVLGYGITWIVSGISTSSYLLYRLNKE